MRSVIKKYSLELLCVVLAVLLGVSYIPGIYRRGSIPRKITSALMNKKYAASADKITIARLGADTAVFTALRTEGQWTGTSSSGIYFPVQETVAADFIAKLCKLRVLQPMNITAAAAESLRFDYEITVYGGTEALTRLQVSSSEDPAGRVFVRALRNNAVYLCGDMFTVYTAPDYWYEPNLILHGKDDIQQVRFGTGTTAGTVTNRTAIDSLLEIRHGLLSAAGLPSGTVLQNPAAYIRAECGGTASYELFFYQNPAGDGYVALYAGTGYSGVPVSAWTFERIFTLLKESA